MRAEDLRQHWVISWRSQAISGLTLAGCSLMLGGALSDNGTALMAGGLSTAFAGRLSRQTAREESAITTDIQVISDQSRANFLFHAMKPTASAIVPIASNIPLQPFEWQSLRDKRDDFPHLLLLGKTGGGKSTLAENLAGLFAGLVIAIAPHWEIGDYVSADVVLGIGRNYGISAKGHIDEPEFNPKQSEPEPEPMLDFDDIINGKVKATVCQFINSLLREMNRRYQLDPATGKRLSGQLITVILDEFNAYALMPGVNGCLKKLIREARKVGIRLILLVQGDEVAALGWEGEGSLRENLTYIRVKNFALDHARYMMNKQKDETMKAFWTEVVRRMTSQERPVMVEDDYAEMPNKGQYYQVKSSQIGIKSYTLATVEHEWHPIRTDSAPFDEARTLSNVVTVTNTVNNGKTFDETYNAKKALWMSARDAIERGKKRSNIIKEVWGYKSERYTLGCQLWRDLTEEFGALETDRECEETLNS